MLNNEIIKIIDSCKKIGWVPEPEAIRLFHTAGLDVPKYIWARTPGEAVEFASRSGYPVVAKVISSRVIHKSTAGGVIVEIESDKKLEEAFFRFKSLNGFEGMISAQR